jgi:hypothetical protein
MERKSFEKYELSTDKEKELWKDSIVIFDTSALLDFYYYPNETRQEIFGKIFLELKNRLWIPYHVQFEYLKNRKRVIEKPIVENYNPLKNKKIKEIVSAKLQILKISEQIKKDTLKPEKHPFLPQEKINEFIKFAETINTRVEQFKDDLMEEISKQETNIKSLKENDTILKAFEDYLEVGSELSHSEIMQIVSEGELRYKFKIPPGYEDENTKIGTQIFGDLIIWKQILSHAKDINKSVIFISNDSKVDWCYKDSRNRIERPREELIKEFNDNNQKDFWMYTQDQFIYKAKKYLKIDFDTEKIEGISNVINNRTNTDLIYKCGKCQQKNIVLEENLNLKFECVSIEEDLKSNRSTKNLECTNCNNQTNIIFEIYEQPIGSHYLEGIYIENGMIIQKPDYISNFWNNYN